MSLEEAKAKGIDVNSLEKKDAATDAISPVGSKPTSGEVAALEEKTQDLKLGSAGTIEQSAVPLPAGEAPKSEPIRFGALFLDRFEPPADLPDAAMTSDVLPGTSTSATEPPKHDLPAQDETGAIHKTIPSAVIVPLSDRDPSKDRTLDGVNGVSSDTAGTKPMSSNPAVRAVDAKTEAEQAPAGTGSTPVVADVSKPADTLPPAAVATPTATSTDATATTTAASVDAPKTATPTDVTPAVTSASTTTPAATSTSTGPQTPAKKTATTAVNSPGGASSTASTPKKDGLEKKRKSGFLSKASAPHLSYTTDFVYGR